MAYAGEEEADLHRSIWDSNAPGWDEAIGESGNSFYRHLVAPTALRLLSLEPDDNVLEIACGNGIFARNLCESVHGVRILATDFSPAMLAAAKARTTEEQSRYISYLKLDATRDHELNSLATLSNIHHGFDAIVCNMAIMDIPTLEPLAQALPKLLRQDGRFVATIIHPSFNSSGAVRAAQIAKDPQTGRAANVYSINVSRYLSIPVQKGEAIMGQEKAQYYFHRPLHEILRPFFENGLVLDGLEEPSFSPKQARPRKELSWQNYSQIPPVMGFRLRRSSLWGRLTEDSQAL